MITKEMLLSKLQETTVEIRNATDSTFLKMKAHMFLAIMDEFGLLSSEEKRAFRNEIEVSDSVFVDVVGGPYRGEKGKVYFLDDKKRDGKIRVVLDGDYGYRTITSTNLRFK